MHRIFHDAGLNKYSPGTALWQHILRDLIERAEFAQVDMGYGDPAYRQHTTNVIEQRARILLFRRTPANRLRIALHHGYYLALASIGGRLRGSPLGGVIKQRLWGVLRRMRRNGKTAAPVSGAVFR